MATRNRPRDRAVALAHRIAATSIDEIAAARARAGLSQRALARAVGMSASQVGRFERGELRRMDLEMLCRLSVGVGLQPALRYFPGGDPVRDVGQVRLLERFRGRIAATLGWATEVPLVGRDDPRAWDGVVASPTCRDGVEAETRLHDVQATERRVMLKLRDDPTIGHVILVIADTRANRTALRASREILRGNLPLDTREVLERLSRGGCPGSSGLVIL